MWSQRAGLLPHWPPGVLLSLGGAGRPTAACTKCFQRGGGPGFRAEASLVCPDFFPPVGGALWPMFKEPQPRRRPKAPHPSASVQSRCGQTF